LTSFVVVVVIAIAIVIIFIVAVVAVVAVVAGVIAVVVAVLSMPSGLRWLLDVDLVGCLSEKAQSRKAAARLRFPLRFVIPPFIAIRRR
jgi:hypothetical protein